MPIGPVKQPFRSNEEEAAASVFSKRSGDVAGDHAGLVKSLQPSVPIALHAILRGDPQRSRSIAKEVANPLVHSPCRLTNIDRGSRRLRLEYASAIRSDPQRAVRFF